MTRRIPRDTYRRVAWKNGAGVSDEIAVDASPQRGWRLALASIERDGPFSDYRGFDRTIVVVQGAGCVLEFEDGERARLEPLQPYTFAGERALQCRLIDGPVQDLNVMTRRGVHTHHVALASDGDLYVEIDDRTYRYRLVGEHAGDTDV